jgi:hypothetical protein
MFKIAAVVSQNIDFICINTIRPAANSYLAEGLR